MASIFLPQCDLKSRIFVGNPPKWPKWPGRCILQWRLGSTFQAYLGPRLFFQVWTVLAKGITACCNPYPFHQCSLFDLLEINTNCMISSLSPLSKETSTSAVFIGSIDSRHHLLAHKTHRICSIAAPKYNWISLPSSLTIFPQSSSAKKKHYQER